MLNKDERGILQHAVINQLVKELEEVRSKPTKTEIQNALNFYLVLLYHNLAGRHKINYNTLKKMFARAMNSI